mmetsp:Transcript_28405/g.57282  ORF Transcript_28405/g.57282 Transcript_28405/m.57282 type:complete len:243 (+) Transcript_28405:178-906(+)
MATSCMNICDEASAAGSKSSSSARAISSCAPKSSPAPPYSIGAAPGAPIEGSWKPSPRAERCEGSVARRGPPRSSLGIAGGGASGGSEPVSPAPRRSFGTTGAEILAAAEGEAAVILSGDSLPRGELCGGDEPSGLSLPSRLVASSWRRESCWPRGGEGDERVRSWGWVLVEPVPAVTPKNSERVGTPRSVPCSAPVPEAADMKSSRVRGVCPRWSRPPACAPPAVDEARGVPDMAKPLRPG